MKTVSRPIHAPFFCVPCITTYPVTLELGATAGDKGSTDILLPVYLENDSSEVGSILFTMMYDSDILKLDTLTLTQRTSGFSNVVPECRLNQLPPGEEEVLLSGGTEAVVSEGSGEIANFHVTVDPSAPSGKYHFTLKRVALVDSLHEEIAPIALRGKFFIPEAPPVSIVCTPISDTLLMRGDTLSFNTTLTNHSWEGVTASVYMYGTVQPDGGNEFLVVDTTYVYLPPNARISSITHLEIPENAPITHYTFTGYVGEGQEIYDEDKFGFDVIGGGQMGKGGPELTGVDYRTIWPLVSGWFEDVKVKIEDDRAQILSSIIPKTFALRQNYPNPFNPTTRIDYDIPNTGMKSVEVVIWIYDLRGRIVRIYNEGFKKPGSYSIFWDGKNDQGQELGSGIYFYRLKVEEFEEIRKMLLVQ